MISEIMKPLDDSFLEQIPESGSGDSWKNIVHFFDGGNIDLSVYKIAILGVKDFRGNESNKGCEDGADEIRKQLYRLKNLPAKVKICDLGNIERGQKQADTLAAVKLVVNELLRNKVIPVILGGDQTLALAQYNAYQGLDQFVNMVLIDEKMTLSNKLKKTAVTTNDFLFRIFTEKPNLLFNFSLLGYQSYYMLNDYLTLLNQMNFDSYRLGKIREDFKETEPVVRDADMLCLNIGALKYTEAPGYADPTPNGFYSDEICQMFRYAGLSDRLTSLGIFDYNPQFDIQQITAKAIAQMIWYFVDGLSQRKADYPIVDENDFHKFLISIDENPVDLIFLKSKKSDRWWIKIDIGTEKSKKHKLFPCTIKDYQTALENEIPDRWLMAYNKLL